MDALQNYMQKLTLQGSNLPYFYWNFYSPREEKKYLIWARTLDEAALSLSYIYPITAWNIENSLILRYPANIDVKGLSPEETRIWEEV